MPSEIADRGPAMLSSLPWMRMMPASSLSMPGDRPGQLGAPGPEQTGDSEHLALDRSTSASLMPEPTLSERALR